MQKIFGTKAIIYLNFKDNIKELAQKISKELSLPNFYFVTNQGSSYDIIGMCETLGFEVWLKKSNVIDDNLYEFEFQTTDSLDELVNDRMYDISLWFARYVSFACEIETCVYIESENKKIEFLNGKMIPN